ncbi:DNA-binding response regulator [Rossellomorea sp. NPDC071047]|uniref:response regulator transcription factor n=1 Tax=Rossellomorea sp. NPDC071047 TaxID=3390675 RepID=UPI003CFC9BE6
MKFILIDEQVQYREGLKKIIEMHVPGSIVYTGDYEGLKNDMYHPIDVVLLDPEIKGISPEEVLCRAQTTYPKAKIALITFLREPQFLSLATIKQEVQGIISKSSTPVTLASALKSLIKGERYISQNLIGSILDSLSPNKIEVMPVGRSAQINISNRPNLTDRQWEILELLTRGFSNSEIAEKLFITEGTASLHVSKIQKKLNVGNRVAAVMKAITNEWIDKSVYIDEYSKKIR